MPLYSKLMVVSCIASTAQCTHCNNNDATTTREYFTDTKIVKIQPSEALPSLMLSLWNSTLNLTISHWQLLLRQWNKSELITPRSILPTSKGPICFYLYFLHAVSGKYPYIIYILFFSITAIQCPALKVYSNMCWFQGLIASHRL